jgi:hypothetical protein
MLKYEDFDDDQKQNKERARELEPVLVRKQK